MKAQYIVAWLRHHNLAFVTAVNELITRNSPPKLGAVPARTAKREPDRAKPQKKSEQAGWFSREPPRPRFRSGAPPNLGALHKKSWAVIDRPYSLGCATVGALYERPRCIF